MATGGRVLKLVHPGGHVEIHYSPIRASEVMDKNPRHFVTRPDVFKFPWVVVRPESILNPGSVFYIVPCRTLYRLLRESRSSQPMVSTMPDSSDVPRGSDIGKLTKPCLKKESHRTSKPPGRHVAFHLSEDRYDEERKALLTAD